MTPVDLKHLGSLLDLLQSKGVESFHGGGLHIEFRAKEAEAVASSPMMEREPEPCPCGHAHFEHQTDGSCLKGCDVEACAPEKPNEQ